MTQQIELTTIRARDIVDGGSRYRNQNVIYWGPRRQLTFDTYIKRPYVPTGNEKVMVIKTDYRPDLVSYDVYGFPDAWWKILEANGMKDIMEFKAGKTIMLPNEVI